MVNRTTTVNEFMSVGENKRPKWLPWLLAVLPVWLLLSAGVAVWYYHFREKRAAFEDQQRFVKSVSGKVIEDDLRKFEKIIGERNGSSEKAARGLKSAATMIEGTLGPGNTGYEVTKIAGPADWPFLQVSIHGKNPTNPAVWVLATYDSKSGSPGIEANATGVCATLAAAQALAGDSPGSPIRFLFIPHGNDPESPVLDVVAKAAELTKDAKAVLVVEAMGAGEDLWLSSREATAVPLRNIDGLGSVRGAEVVCLGEDSDFASLMCESGVSAVRVATRAQLLPEEPDDNPAAASVVAASAGRLVELIRRCAALP